VGNTVVLTLVSEDGDEGYPGTLTLKVTYELADDNSLHISYHGTTDAATIVNVTNHSYFNLAGAGSGTILDHVVESSVSHYTPVGPDLIPTGELASVKDTPFDFSVPTAIGARIDQVVNGYDHNLVVPRDGVADGELCPTFFKVTDPVSGRSVEVRTTEPGMQLYCGGFLGGMTGREGKVRNSSLLHTLPHSYAYRAITHSHAHVFSFLSPSAMTRFTSAFVGSALRRSTFRTRSTRSRLRLWWCVLATCIPPRPSTHSQTPPRSASKPTSRSRFG
jgi:hypothetical protein